ncbi:unnamed protein product [Toxocara canis]|uniref:Uncharacterized protein n=1 Tax=Toxocara canis TaxID=6265 RepID=A0A183UH15_TOXCA|nr:unnamed protein product [Toxocara canis]
MCNLNAVIVIVRSKTLNIACYKYLRDQIQNAIVKMRHLFTISLNFALLMSANGSFITTVLCIGACNAGAMACYAGMGAVFGTVTAGVFIVSLRTCGGQAPHTNAVVRGVHFYQPLSVLSQPYSHELTVDNLC